MERHPYFLPMRLFYTPFFLFSLAAIAISLVIACTWHIATPHKKNFLIKNNTIKTSPTPIIYPFLCHGTYEFIISVGTTDKPKLITEGNLEPCDPEPGDAQILEVFSIPEAQDLAATIMTDTKQRKIPFVQDQKKKNVWQASWTLNDTYFYTYTIIVHGKVRDDKQDVIIMFR